MAPGIPSQVVPVSVIVLLYSSVCLSLSSMLTGLLVSFGESWSYVTIFAGFTALSTAASIAQQLHYATSFIVIKQAQFDKAVLVQTVKGLAFGGAAHPVDEVLFDIQSYCYNVMALNILFWTISLFTGSWGIRSKWLGSWYDRVAPISKAFSIIFPGLLIGLLYVDAVKESAGIFVFVSYISLFISLSVGSILLILILYKYMKTRRLVSGYSKRGRWWAPPESSKSKSENRSGNQSGNDVATRYTAETAATSSMKGSIYDRALLTRFSIGFVILALFEVAIIVFSIFQSNNNASIAASGKPDQSSTSAISDILFFIPGVTASLVAFLVFGTTKNWRQYRDLVIGGCGIRKKMITKKVQRAEEHARPQPIEFERLPSLHKTPTEEERQRGKEAAQRVKMFVKETVLQDDSSNEDGEGSNSSRIRVDTERIVQFHSISAEQGSPVSVRFEEFPPISTHAPRTATSRTSIRKSSVPNLIDAGLSFEQPPESSPKKHHLRQISAPGEPRRFVVARLTETQTQSEGQNTERDFIDPDSGD